MNMGEFLKKHTKIDGREAFERLSNGISVFDKNGTEVKLDFDKNDYFLKSISGVVSYGRQLPNESKLNLSQILSWTWYVKKPFDVRAEMLARPSEWVGAYKDEGVWWKVGLNLYNMCAVTQSFKFEGSTVDFPSRGVDKASLTEIKACIPIEDVPKEEIS